MTICKNYTFACENIWLDVSPAVRWPPQTVICSAMKPWKRQRVIHWITRLKPSNTYHFQTFTLVNFQTFPVRNSHFQLHVRPWSSKKDSNIFWIHIGQVHSSPLPFLGFLGREPDIVSDFLNTVSTSQARVRKTSSACQHCYPESFCKTPKTVRTIQKLSVQSRNCPDNPETVPIIQKVSMKTKNCPNNPKNVQTIQKLSGQSKNSPYNQ